MRSGQSYAEGKLFLCGLVLLALIFGYFQATGEVLRSAITIALFCVGAVLLYALEKFRRDSKYGVKNAKDRQETLAMKIKELEDSKTETLKIIHALQMAKAHLEEEKSRDEAMLSSLGEALVVTDGSGKIRLVNPVFEQLLEWKISEIIGKHVLDVIPIQDEKGVPISLQQQFKSVLEEGKKITVDTAAAYYYVKKNKGRFPVAITVTPIMLGKQIAGAVQVFRDVTREKEMDEAKTEFVSLASHQLRTPLATVNWYTEMLLDGDAGRVLKTQREYLDQIYHANQRMVELVNAFLNVSRVEFGTFTVEPEPINMVEITESVVAEMKPQIEGKHLKIVQQYEENIPLVPADPKLVRIIVQNLLSNAVKYTPEKGQIDVQVSLNRESLVYNEKLQKRYIRIAVKDTGYGIPEAEQSKIFSKMFRADNVKEIDAEGTGLGLYLVKAVLNMVGGMIWFESRGKNQGTAFYVTIPVEGMQKKKGTRKLE